MLFTKSFIIFFSLFLMPPCFLTGTAFAGTNLHSAAKQGDAKQVRKLLAEGLNVNSLSKSGHTPLHISALWDKRRVTGLLVKNGAKVNAINSSGQTPLHLAARRGHIKMVKFLLSRGANPWIKDRSRRTPADLAQTYSFNDEIVDLLESSPNKNPDKGSWISNISKESWYVLGGGLALLLVVPSFFM